MSERTQQEKMRQDKDFSRQYRLEEMDRGSYEAVRHKDDERKRNEEYIEFWISREKFESEPGFEPRTSISLACRSTI